MEIQSHSLSSSQKKPFQEWLSSRHADLLVSLLESRIFKMEAEAAMDISACMAEGLAREAMIELAKSKAADIEMNRKFIATLREFRDAETLETYTVTPTKIEL